jgi:hypothetical protein
LLAGDQAVVQRMRNAGLQVALIAQSEATTDLPEYSYLRGTRAPDGRPYDGPDIRGLGGSPCSAGEENVMGLPGDTFAGEKILVHECAHGVYWFALDAGQRSRWQVIYAQSMAAGRWTATYAAVNADEFFAELTQSYFAVNQRPQAGIHNDINSAAQLMVYEPLAYHFLLSVFGPGR